MIRFGHNDGVDQRKDPGLKPFAMAGFSQATLPKSRQAPASVAANYFAATVSVWVDGLDGEDLVGLDGDGDDVAP